MNGFSISSIPFLGDPHARLQTLLPDNPSADMAVNCFTYDPGATLPFVETHVMEHGMLFLEGGGVYRLGDDCEAEALATGLTLEEIRTRSFQKILQDRCS